MGDIFIVLCCSVPSKMKLQLYKIHIICLKAMSICVSTFEHFALGHITHYDCYVYLGNTRSREAQYSRLVYITE